MTDERQQTEPAYEIYLDLGDDVGVDVESPIHTSRIDYYDSGVWVDRDPGRTFLPYDRIVMIEERPATDAAETGESGESTETDESDEPTETDESDEPTETELEAESAEESNAPVSSEQDLE